ncbi:hypothetical protein TSAR_005370 [Trichomalopsis sarcophagae]|uniref:DUF4806 domain-containing protein n=1 Tax=Trichomalopsis sarcophagae TaxID=543379 RepID=A0A232EL31_9HYME|nr:hypothetical protein TSAR_005370 [Trichomalopsis sarcophagae]
MRRKKVQESDLTEDEETTDGEKGVLTYQDFPTGPSSRTIDDETAISISTVNDQLSPTKASADKEAEGDPKEISITAELTEITATICKPISNTFAALQNEISVDADKELLAVEKQDNVTGKDRDTADASPIIDGSFDFHAESLQNLNQDNSSDAENDETTVDAHSSADASPIIDGSFVFHAESLQNLNQDNSSDAENDETTVDAHSSGNQKLSCTTTFMWYIVKLSQKPEAVVVPGFWLNLDRKECAWPQTNTEYVIQNNIVNRLKPLKNWVTRGVTDILGFADSFDEAVMKQQRAWGKENRGIKRTADQTNLNDDGKRKNFKKTAPKIVTEEHRNYLRTIGGKRLTKHDVTREKLGSILSDKVDIQLKKKPFSTLRIWDLIHKMLHEVLRNQAEEKLQNERRQYLLPVTRNYLRTIGGKRLTKHDVTREKLGSILSDKVAIHYNFCGTNRQLKKKPFSSLRIWDLIHNEIVDSTYQTKEADYTCKTWLKQAKKRIETTAKKLKTSDKDKEHEGELTDKGNQHEAQENKS